MQYGYPVIPETITVHLGAPDENARNIEIPFIDYIKNVASSEIYPTWPENAIRANIYAQVSYALNRIYTEWYRSRGYDFDITNSTQYDQAFVEGRDIFENIGRIVDDLFNDYVQRQGSVEPYFTQYCNGITSTCPGLSQWGTVTLANEGYQPYEILQHYYGEDINIVFNAPVQDVPESYPGIAQKLGMRSNDIRILQGQLNRIRQNYPAIPQISQVNGVFGADTERAVRAFQRIFQLEEDGIVGKATWYRIKQIYNGVKKLSELDSEGIRPEELEPVVLTDLIPGTYSNEMKTVQYYLAVIGYFISGLPEVEIDGYYGPETEEAIRQFQNYYGLPVTGRMDRETWNRVVRVYNEINASIPDTYYQGTGILFPGFMQLGMEGDGVRELQRYLIRIADVYPDISATQETGYFGQLTLAAVNTFQQHFGLPVTGIVGPATWDVLVREYNQIL
ncbi:MAG: spore cortex-lytic protein [Clostridiales bacterium]|nr:MAG: spore cortex-lytic protein [Clostridiales bacterium]